MMPGMLMDAPSLGPPRDPYQRRANNGIMGGRLSLASFCSERLGLNRRWDHKGEGLELEY